MTKKIKYNKSAISTLSNNKPALYKIKTATGTLNYAGTAQRGRVQERISEHLGEIPGLTIEIEQFSSIKAAQAKELRVIMKNQPKYNIKGKSDDEKKSES